MAFTVVGLGEVLWDLLPSGPQLGGAPMNYIYQAGVLGARAMMVTRIGDDVLGKDVIRRLVQFDLASETVQVDSARPTGTAAVTLDEQGVPRYTFAQDAAWEYLEATYASLQAVRGAQAVCFGTLGQRNATSRNAIQQLVAAVPADALKMFDVNLRLNFYSRDVIEQSMRLSNLLKVNDEELALISSMFSLHGDVRQRIVQLVLAFGFKVVVVTCGSSGSIIYREGHWSELPSQRVPIVDTVGAGDAFAAALTMGLLAGMSLREVHVMATEVAGHVCSQHGATPPLPEALRSKFVSRDEAAPTTSWLV